MRMYELRYGDARSAFSVSAAPSTAAVADETRIYFGSINARFSCYQIQGGLRFWQVLTGGSLTATPQIHDDEIYFASQGGGIFVALKANKSGQWKAKAGTGIYGDLAIDADRVYAASKDRNVYAFDRITGDAQWIRQLPAPLFDGPVRSHDTLYQSARAAGLFALDPATGVVRWSRPGRARVVGVDESRVYLTDETGEGIVADSSTGKVLATFEAAAAELALTNVRDDALFFASRRGTVICVRRRDAPPMGRTQLALASAKKPTPAADTVAPPAGAAAELPDPIRPVLQDPFRSRSTVAPLTGRPSGN